jgi:hypothetical protein
MSMTRHLNECNQVTKIIISLLIMELIRVMVKIILIRSIPLLALANQSVPQIIKSSKNSQMCINHPIMTYPSKIMSNSSSHKCIIAIILQILEQATQPISMKEQVVVFCLLIIRLKMQKHIKIQDSDNNNRCNFRRWPHQRIKRRLMNSLITCE